MQYEAQHKQFENLVVGSSHALYGIYEKAFSGGCVNLSMHSQDLYYDFVNVKNCIEADKGSVKRCFIIMGYYIINQDLSLSTKIRESIIQRVYEPIFHDTHHWTDCIPIDLWSEMGDIRLKEYSRDQVISICEEVIRNAILKQGTYFNGLYKKRTPFYDFSGKKWEELSDEERDDYGKRRAESHNALVKHEQSFLSNRMILLDMIKYLSEKEITPIVVITPFSKEYMKYMNEDYKTRILQVLGECEEEVHFIDFNESTMFLNEDFLDTDHLSLAGSIKVSCELNEIFTNLS